MDELEELDEIILQLAEREVIPRKFISVLEQDWNRLKAITIIKASSLESDSF
jgi:hypothetical protein